MARILITGSSDGIGQAAAKLLADSGHSVTLHARNAERAKQAKEAVPQAANVLIGDLASINDTKRLAEEANQAGPWDAVIHNAGLGPSASYAKSQEGIAATFHVNTLAPYILTCLIAQPKRLLYLSSGMHFSGDDSLKDVAWKTRRWNSSSAYCDSKLHDVLLSLAFARLWPDVVVASMDPGWVKTKMGGGTAPGDVGKPARMLASWAAGESTESQRTGIYFAPSGETRPHSSALDEKKQDDLLKICQEFSGVSVAT